MMWMIPTSILMTAAIISLLLLTNWIRKDSESRFQMLLEEMKEGRRSYTALTQTLLGVQPDFQPRHATTSTQPERPSWSEPEADFGSLPIDQDLMREYSEFLAQNGTLSGKPARTHPDVPQFIPGQVTMS